MTKTFVAINDPVHSLLRAVTRHTPLHPSLSTDQRLPLRYNFQEQDLPGTLQRQGGFIPGIRPGKATEQYLNNVVTKITLAGALFLAVVAIVPFIARGVGNMQAVQVSSMGLLIMVGVVLDTMKQMEAQLTMRRYEGFIK